MQGLARNAFLDMEVSAVLNQEQHSFIIPGSCGRHNCSRTSQIRFGAVIEQLFKHRILRESSRHCKAGFEICGCNIGLGPSTEEKSEDVKIALEDGDGKRRSETVSKL